jgi:Fe-S-cluster containining protein
MTPMHIVAEAYRDLLKQLDRWFEETSGNHPGVVPCRAGCAACCHGPFDISIADALLVREAVRALPATVRTAIEMRARALEDRIQGLAPGWEPAEGLTTLDEEVFDEICETLAAEPCPLLDQDECTIYQDRPMICRVIGLGIVTPTGRIIENACPIADQFPDYRALPPQRLDLESWEEAEQACLEAASMEILGTPSRGDFDTTIASALSR